eukprot:GFUD01028873.1.p1 GENE.GFUD01028873.1~~GFUD01028873.1.p1  ORF type:complete len:177 (+),score=53.43 GFUD01028873.1:33-563(+)
MENKDVDETEFEKDRIDLETTETKTEVEKPKPKMSSLVIPRNVDKDTRNTRKQSVAFNDEPAEIDKTDTTEGGDSLEKDSDRKAGNSKRTKEQIIQQLRLTIYESSSSFIPSSHSSYPVTPPVARREGDDPPTPPPTPFGNPYPSSVIFGDTLYNMNDQVFVWPSSECLAAIVLGP